MKRRGVSTLYLATSHHRSPTTWSTRVSGVGDHRGLTHDAGMKVGAWYQPCWSGRRATCGDASHAIRFETENGRHVDSFASTSSRARWTPVERRQARLLRLAARLRDEVGSSYALGAIVPSPRLLELYPNSWRDFPFRRLARYFDVFLPMAYWTYHASTFAGARDYTRDSVSGIRRLTGDRDMPVHAIRDGAARHGRGHARLPAWHPCLRDGWDRPIRLPHDEPYLVARDREASGGRPAAAVMRLESARACRRGHRARRQA